jgi:hypothetical protein
MPLLSRILTKPAPAPEKEAAPVVKEPTDSEREALVYAAGVSAYYPAELLLNPYPPSEWL